MPRRKAGLALLNELGTIQIDQQDSGCCLAVALARGSREPGQDLSVAAISGVLLCEGLWRADGLVSGLVRTRLRLDVL